MQMNPEKKAQAQFQKTNSKTAQTICQKGSAKACSQKEANLQKEETSCLLQMWKNRPQSFLIQNWTKN